MVPDIIWAPDFFGPREIGAQKNLVPKKFGSCMKTPHNDFHAGANFFTKKVRGPNVCGDHFSYSLILLIKSS